MLTLPSRRRRTGDGSAAGSVGRAGRAGLVLYGAVALCGCTGEINDAKHAAGGASGSSGGSSGSAGASSGGAGGSSGSANGSGGDASGGSDGTAGSSGAGGTSGSAGGSSSAAGGSGRSTTGSGGSGTSDAGTDASTADPCGNALFCEKFDDYAGVTSIDDKQKLGPWHAALLTGATMGLDGTHRVSGSMALHVHIDQTVTAGGRLFADGAQPIFASKPTHVYGRLMMYIDPNGTSEHWTFFGVNGNAEPSSPAVGRNAQYIMSSLPRNGVNTYSFVYGLQSTTSDPYHDCSSQSSTAMPSTWACVSFEMDSVARELRMYKDCATAPILSVDDHGNGCVKPTAVDSPWYGPSITQLFVGAWSFHAMNAPLDVWVDDLAVDTKPIACPR